MIYYNEHKVEKAQDGLSSLVTNLTASITKAIVGKVGPTISAVNEERAPEGTVTRYDDRPYDVYNLDTPGYGQSVLNLSEQLVRKVGSLNAEAHGIPKRFTDPAGPAHTDFTVVDLGGDNLGYVRTGEYVKGAKRILGGDFINADGSSRLTTRDTFNPNVYNTSHKDNTSKVVYGIEDGRLKIGKPEDFAPGTKLVTPTHAGTYRSVGSRDFFDTIGAATSDVDTKRQHAINKLRIYQGEDHTGGVRYNALNDAGKIIIYSPSTGAKQMVSGSVQEIREHMNKFASAFPDSEFIEVDNGTFSSMVGDGERELTKEDHRSYWNLDQGYPSGGGMTLVSF